MIFSSSTAVRLAARRAASRSSPSSSTIQLSANAKTSSSPCTHACHSPAALLVQAVPSSRRHFWWGASSASASGAAGTTDAALDLAASSIPHISPDLTLLLLAVVLASNASEDDEKDAHSPPWTVTDMTSAGKGFGALANRDLKKGELILNERPLVIWPQGLSAQQAQELFDTMSEKQKQVFMSLSVTEGEGLKAMDPILARRATNGFAVQLPGVSNKTVAAIFPILARLNHSCLPNASQAMNHGTLRMEVYPITSIPASTEITIEYLPSLVIQTHAERQASLKSSFGFPTCLCQLCSSPPEVIAQSDSRRTEIKTISEALRGGRGDRQATFAKMERLRVLLESEGYLGLPEFDDMNVSNAYAVYATLHARRQAGSQPADAAL